MSDGSSDRNSFERFDHHDILATLSTSPKLNFYTSRRHRNHMGNMATAN